MYFSPYLLYRSLYEWIVRTAEDECFDIRRETREIDSEEVVDLLSMDDPLLDQWDESWRSDFFDSDILIEDMDSITIGSYTDSCLSREDSDMVISSFDNSLSSRDGDTEDFSTDHRLSLEPSESMDTRGIASDDDDISSLIEEALHSIIGK